MKRHWIEYRDAWVLGPMTFWGHVETDGRPWHDARLLEPTAPSPIPGKGFAGLFVEFAGATLYFASLDELRVAIDTLGLRVLPTSRNEASRRTPATRLGPNQHWLSRLPSKPLPWPRRQKLVCYLGLAQRAFQRELSRQGNRA